ncbi:unnamed protein product [Adineta steineri]|nr:unnamed protein product [Adineta steineri]
MWQLIATFCHYANSTLLEVLDEFANTPLISSKLIPEELLRTQTLTALNNAHQTALDGVNQSITFADRITQASGLMTGLATNAVIGLPINVWQSEQIVPTFSTKYKRHESTTLCYCINDVSCPMPGGLYFYDEWETNGIYDLNVIVPNATIPGLVVDCLPTQTMFASTVECFYNQSCLDILLSAYQVNIDISILNISLSSRFTPTTTLSYLVNELFIEQIFNETMYGSYYQQCAPVYCSYTYSQRFDLVYVITTLIALFGGLNIALHLIAPYLIDCLLLLKKKLFLQNEFQQNETPIPTFQNRFHNLVKKDVWLNFLYGGDDIDGGIWYLLSRYDIRVRGTAYFQLVSLLCSISQTTIKNAVNQFVEETFVNAQAISQPSFFVQTNATIRQFQTSTTSEFSRTLQLIRDITHGNTFISSFRLNWRWLVAGENGNSTVPIDAISPTNNCSCGTRSDCVQPGGIYMIGYNFEALGIPNISNIPSTQMFAMPGFNVGCSSVETLFRSTFECLYNQTCIDQLQMFAITIYPPFPNATDYITAMNSTFVSRFQPNMTIVDIVNELFIEEWQVNVSYSKFYGQCAPTYCSYTLETSPTFIYIITQTIGIYGGLTVALRYISLYTIQLASYIGNRGRNNRVASLT